MNTRYACLGQMPVHHDQYAMSNICQGWTDVAINIPMTYRIH